MNSREIADFAAFQSKRSLRNQRYRTAWPVLALIGLLAAFWGGAALAVWRLIH